MSQSSLLLGVLFTLIAVLAFTICARRLRAWWASRRARKRAARAGKGEVRAEKLLRRKGYRILDRQVAEVMQLECDGEIQEFKLRADLLVERHGVVMIAEVKTGERAPDLRNSATRRQLLEYALAYDSPTILLVDVESSVVQEVRIPIPSRGKVDAWQSATG